MIIIFILSVGFATVHPIRNNYICVQCYFRMGGRVSSPLSTGGAGTTFEQHVGAMFLALLLTRGIPAVFRDCQVEEVSFQTGQRGWETDDLLVTCSSRDVRRMLAMQIRRSFTIGKSNDCKETIQRFWNDFGAHDRFNPDRDILILATLDRTENLGGFASLLKCARSSPSSDDFKDRLNTSGFVSDVARRCYRDINAIVNNADPSDSISEEMLWCFLKTMYVLFLDFTTDAAQQESTVTQWLALSSGGPDAIDAARNTWYKLVAVAADAASCTKTFRYYDLPGDMRDRYGVIPVPVLQTLTDHSATILKGIRSTIGDTTTLPRTEVTTEAAMALGDRVTVLTGQPGSGKSALAKAVIKQHSVNHLCLSFRATEFAKSHIDDVLLGAISGERFRLFVGAQENALIYVDGLEHLLEYSVRNAFDDLVAIVESCPNVSLMLTCRDNETEKAIATFFGRNSLTCRKVRVPLLNADEMEWVGREIPSLEAPLSRPELEQIMSTPQVLNMAARMDWSDRQNVPADIIVFRKKWWSEVVRNDGETADGLPSRRGRALVDLAVRRARELRPSVPTSGMDERALDKLHKDGIVVVGDDGLAAPTHDVIEDWAVIRWIESCAIRHEWMTHPMASDIGTHPAIRRGFREWLKEWLDTDAEGAERFVLATHDDDSLPLRFRDDVLIPVLLSDSVKDFVSRHKDRMLADDAHLLVRMMHLTQVVRTKAPGLSDESPRHKSMLLEPEGEAWPVLLEVIDGSLERLLPRHYGQILEMLTCWARRYQSPTIPDGSIPAISVAYRLLQIPNAPNDDTRRILEIIAGVPRAYSESFLSLVERASSKSEWRNIVLGKFRDILMGRLGFPACRDFPKEMAGFVWSSCIPEEPDMDSIWTWHEKFSPEFKFGLYPYASSDYKHFSAFRGPFWPLLKFHPDIGIQLVLDLANHAGDWYGTKGEDVVPRIVVSVPGHVGVIQWADDRLWQAYRGASEVPHVIACALMALEHWLLKICEHGYNVRPWLLKILRESRNVMTTGVVASVCSAYPDLCGAVLQALLKSKECVSLDQSRVKKEGEPPLGRYAAVSRDDRYYDDERRQSNALPHRRRDLKALASKLQDNLPPQYDDAGIKRRGAVPDTGKTYAGWNRAGSGMGEDPRTDISALLHAWGTRRWRREADGGDLQSWRRALALSKDNTRQHAAPDPEQSTEGGPPTVAAVCVRDHWEDMSDNDRMWCAHTLANEVRLDCNSTDFVVCQLHSHAGASQMAAHTLPKILAHDPGNKEVLEAVALAIIHAASDVSRDAARGVAEYLGSDHQDLMMRCAGTVAMLPNLIPDDKNGWSRTRWRPIPRRSDGTPNPRELAGQAFVKGHVDADLELQKIDLTSWHGRHAAGLIIPMLCSAPDLPVTGRFIAKTLQAVMSAKTTGPDVLYVGPDLEFENDIMGSLADAVLAMPREVTTFCGPLLDAVDGHPDKAARFIKALVLRKSSAGQAFWDVWQAFADRITEPAMSSRMLLDDYKVAELVRMMLFNMRWNEDSRSWERLADHGEKVNEFVRCLPSAPHVLASFVFYLYKVGEDSLPDALSIVAGHLRTKNHDVLPIDKSTVYFLESILQRYVYGEPKLLQANQDLRQDTILILDRLVDSGSPAAYKMRDYFTAPDSHM